MATGANILGCALVLLGLASSALAGGNTLVLVDNLAIRETHSVFFKSLKGLYFLHYVQLIAAGHLTDELGCQRVTSSVLYNR